MSPMACAVAKAFDELGRLSDFSRIHSMPQVELSGELSFEVKTILLTVCRAAIYNKAIFKWHVA